MCSVRKTNHGVIMACRKPLGISPKIVCESLQAHRSVMAAANELGCSQAYIFGVLKANGLKPKDVISNKTKHY